MLIKTRPGFWRDLWALIKPYWIARTKTRASSDSSSCREKLIGGRCS